MTRVSKQLGPYEILDVVGAGGMGVVYRARDTRLDRQVAIKVLLPEVASSEDAIARFEREVRAVAAISHPNILAIHDFQRDGGTVYAVMEFLDGRTLRAMVNDSPLSVRKAVHLGVQIAHGLAAAHARNIVHRDLKPENIGLMRSGQVKILDFGLARHVVPQAARADSPTCAQVSTAGMILGTVGYMSPEQVRGHDADHRSDLFSFGVVFHEMLTGRRAFARATAAETLTAILNDEPSDLADSGAKVPPALDRVIQRCLEKHPEDRFHSARDLAFALENALTANGGAVVPPARRRTGPMWVAAVLVAGSLAAGAGISFYLRPVTEQYSVRSLTLSGQDGDPAASPAGDLVAYTSNRDGDAQIWIRDIDAVTQQAIERPIPGAKGHRPRFFPDGKSLLFLRDEGSSGEAAFYVNLNGVNPRPLSLVNIVEADPSPRGDGEIAWIRDSVDEQGRRFAQVGVYNTTTRQERPLFDKQADVEFANVRWSPNGRQIAAIRRSVVSTTSTSIVIIDRADGRRHDLDREGVGAYGSLAWTGDSRALVVTQSAAAQVFVPGVLGRILKIDVASNRQQVLLRQPNLFGRSTRANANATIDVMGDGRLVFSSIQIRQTLRECELIDGGGCADNAAAGRKGVGTRGNSNDRQPAYSPDGRFIVFSSNRTGQLDLWVQDTQTGGIWQLTDDPDLDWDPAFTPDGTHVLWSSNRQSDHLEIWKARFDPTPKITSALTDVTRVSSDGKDAQNPTMTKNGKWIVYASNNEADPGIWKVPTAGGESLPLVRGQFVRLADASPSGRYAAYLVDDRVGRQNAIRVVDVETGLNTGFEIKVPYRRTESTADVTWGRARWMMNNGEWIVFVGQDRQTDQAAVYKQRFSSSGEDTWATRVLLVNSLPEASTESIAVEPDCRDISVSDGYYSRSLMLAEHVPGVVGRPRRN